MELQQPGQALLFVLACTWKYLVQLPKIHNILITLPQLYRQHS